MRDLEVKRLANIIIYYNHFINNIIYIYIHYISNIFTASRLRCVLHCFALHLPVRLTCCTSQPIAELIFWADMSSALWYKSCRWRPLHLPHEVPNHAAFRSVYPQLVATLQVTHGCERLQVVSSHGLQLPELADASGHCWTLLDMLWPMSHASQNSHLGLRRTRMTSWQLGRQQFCKNVYHLVNVFNPSEKY